MNEIFDIYTVIFLVIAILVVLRLRAVLGRRTGHERPPFDPYEAPQSGGGVGNERPAPIRQRETNGSSPATGPRRDWAQHARPGSKLAKLFDELAQLDPQFDPGTFVDGAKMAYESIVTAFAGSDRDALRPLLGREVFEGFLSVMDSRDARGEHVDSKFISIDRAEIVGGTLNRGTAQLTIHFVSQMISVTYDKEGTIIDGHAERVRKITDIWTFSRSMASRNPNWHLVATEAA